MKRRIVKFLDGFFVPALITGSSIFVGLAVANHILTAPPETPPEKFKIVDHYGTGCSVVRYTPPNSLNYVYFLDCTAAHLRE